MPQVWSRILVAGGSYLVGVGAMIAVVKCTWCGAEYEMYNADKWLSYSQLRGEEWVKCENCGGNAYVKQLVEER